MLCRLVGIPVEEGAGRPGCAAGPDALRAAGLEAALRELGHAVEDRGDLSIPPASPIAHANPAIRSLERVASWIAAGEAAAYGASDAAFPIFLGGDHSLAAGTVAGVARRLAETGQPLFVLWLDAHPDFHSLDSTVSGNLHGVPLAYLTGNDGFEAAFPAMASPVRPERVCAVGLRSVDRAENQALARAGVFAADMNFIDRRGIAPAIEAFIERVGREGGRIHVSLDTDFLDPSIAPGVGTPVPGGVTFREAHLTMELLGESGLVGSLDVVELNPLHDDGDRTARLLVDLVASLLGRRILHPTIRGM